ncbi:filamentous hemagglutinin N-terminal domain-containing protein [Methylosinus sp. C49]|uniref:two-partner secretion domain-containing protein n=1 Tax=Methylosinus sp. C49 TaxID=2699395 RepID=UPI001FCE6CE8|nr:filamentous hemagglutinin N-terminal domain-containing protein [Methylosinus sp. C49]
MLALPSFALANPTGGVVVDGAATISSTTNVTNVVQSTNRAIINWQSFSIGLGETVNFYQPSALAVTLNRVVGNEQSVIAGALNANGKVFLVNSNGILFTKDAQVNVGGLVASTLDISNSNFMAGNYAFSGSSAAAMVNKGTINAADGGYVALLGRTVSNEGTINAKLGTIALASGDAITLNFSGDSLLDVTIDKGTYDALVENKGLIKADGGNVVMTAKAADAVLSAQVNNSGIIQARTIGDLTGGSSSTGSVKIGKIKLLAQGGTTKVSGTLDASAPNGGKGGTIETSGEKVTIADGTLVTTASSTGESGNWIIDPTNFAIVSGSAAQTTSGVGASTLLSNLANGNVTITTAASGSDSGDINVNAALAWSANTLTLNAASNINVNAPMTWGGLSGLALNAGQSGVGSIYVNAVMTANGAASFAATYGNGTTVTGSIPNGTTTGLAYSYTVPDGIFMAMSNGANADGTPIASFVGRLDFNSTGSLTIGGKTYTVITTWAQLAALSGTASGNYALASDLSAPTTALKSSVIGSLTGNLNGLGHTISGLTIASTSSNIGLIGQISGGSVANIGLLNVNLDGTSFVGAVAGQMRGGTIGNVFATGSIGHAAYDYTSGTGSSGGLVGQAFVSPGTASAGTIFDSWANVTILGGSGLGGFIGANTGATIINSAAYGNVTGTATYNSDASASNNTSQLGGFAGTNNGLIVDANSYGNVSAVNGTWVGGFVGANNILSTYANRVGRIVDSNSYGDVSITFDATAKEIGGFAGVNYGYITRSSEYGDINLYIPENLNWSNISNISFIGGFVGHDYGYTSDNSVYGRIYLHGHTSKFYLVGSFAGALGDTFTAGHEQNNNVICNSACDTLPPPIPLQSPNSTSTGMIVRNLPAEAAAAAAAAQAAQAAAQRVAAASGAGNVVSDEANRTASSPERGAKRSLASAGKQAVNAQESTDFDDSVKGAPSAQSELPPARAHARRDTAKVASAGGRKVRGTAPGAGYGAHIRSIDVDGQRFDLGNGGKISAPAPKAQ